MEIRVRKDFLEKYMKENNLTKTEFCKLCKISGKTYNKMIEESGEYSVNALLRIARVIDVELYEFFKF